MKTYLEGNKSIIFREQIAPATTFCLGVWQYNRRNWKIDLIAELQEKVVAATPIQLE